MALPFLIPSEITGQCKEFDPYTDLLITAGSQECFKVYVLHIASSDRFVVQNKDSHHRSGDADHRSHNIGHGKRVSDCVAWHRF